MFQSLYESMCLAGALGPKCSSCLLNTGVMAVDGNAQCFPFSFANLFLENSTEISKIWMESHYVTNSHERGKRFDIPHTLTHIGICPIICCVGCNSVPLFLMQT